MTARRVAAQRMAFPRLTPTTYGRPEDDRALEADVAGDLSGIDSPLKRYLRARTLFVDRTVVDAIDDGTTQVVVVGAGYDGRSLRYAKTGVRFFELDHPDTQSDKLARLRRLGVRTDGVSYGALDLFEDDAGTVLGGLGHEREVPTLFVCEGVVAYLTESVFAALLSSLHRVAAPDSRLAMEVALVPQSDEDRRRRSALHDAVSSVGEPLRYALEGARLRPFFTAGGWTLRRATDPAGRPLESSAPSVAFVVAAPEPATATDASAS